MHRAADCVVRRVIPESTEWRRIGNQINAAMIFARSDSVGVHACKPLQCPRRRTKVQYGKLLEVVSKIDTPEGCGKIDLLIVQPRKIFAKRVPSILRTRANCSRWFGEILNRLIAEIDADLPRFSEGRNRSCFSRSGHFGKVHRHRLVRADLSRAPAASR